MLLIIIVFSFAYGKASGLVLDSGHVHTVVTPVHEGFALQKGIFIFFLFIFI
jgi:actin-related protein